MIIIIDFLVQLRVILLALTFLLLFAGIKSNKNKYKYLFYNLSAVFFSLFIYEAIVLDPPSKEDRRFGDYVSGDYFYRDIEYVLGYGPTRQDGVFSSILTDPTKQDTVYSVSYTIKDKIRFTPNSNYESDEYRVFLGCSQTFGEGLNDDETFPYHFNEVSGNRFKIMNFGFHGYGPHQALAIVENLLVTDSLLTNNPERVQVFYNFYYYHILRAAGYGFWDKFGPWYEVEGEKLVYKGSFSDKNPLERTKYLGEVYERLWLKSNIYNKFFNKYNQDNIEQVDIKRAMFLIREMKAILSKKNIKFFLLVDRKTSNDKSFLQFVAENNISTVCLECEIADFGTNQSYRIEGDGHLTGKANKLKAELLFSKLLKNELRN